MYYIKLISPFLVAALACTLSYADNKKQQKELGENKPAIAGEVQSKEKKRNNKSEEIKSIPDSTFVEETLTNSLDSTTLVNSVENNCANEKVTALETRVEELMDQVTILQDRLTRADTCYLQLAIICCELDYKPERVALAARCMKNINSDELKATFEDVNVAVNCYSTYYDEIMQLLREAQTDDERTITFAAEEYKHAILEKLQNTAYRKEFHGKKRIISLNFIDKIYTEAEKIIKSHSQDHPADFSVLLLNSTI